MLRIAPRDSLAVFLPERRASNQFAISIFWRACTTTFVKSPFVSMFFIVPQFHGWHHPSFRRFFQDRAAEAWTPAPLRHPATAATVAAPRLPPCLRLLAPLTLLVSPPVTGWTGNSGLDGNRRRSSGTSERTSSGTPPGKTRQRSPNCHHGTRGPRPM